MKIPNSKKLSDYPVFFLKEMHHPQFQLHLPSHNAGSLVDSWLTIGHIDPTWWHLPSTKWRTWREHLNLHSSSSALLQMFWICKNCQLQYPHRIFKMLKWTAQKKNHNFQPWIRLSTEPWRKSLQQVLYFLLWATLQDLSTVWVNQYVASIQQSWGKHWRVVCVCMTMSFNICQATTQVFKNRRT